MAVDRSRKARGARRRKRRMARVEHDLSGDQWTALKEAWGGCAYCGATGTPLQRDCVQALSRGGRYTLDNIAPACGSCNASKCNDEVTGWLRRKRLDERAFLLRRLEITTALAMQFPAEPAVQPPSPKSSTPTRADTRTSVGVEALSRGDSELALVDEVAPEVLGEPLLPRVRVRGGNVVRGAEPDDIEDLERAYRSAGADTPRLVDGLGIGEAVQEKGAGRVQ